MAVRERVRSTSMGTDAALALVAHLWAKKWNVQMRERYAHVEGVLNYSGDQLRRIGATGSANPGTGDGLPTRRCRRRRSHSDAH